MIRGVRNDYDRFAALGNDGWSWDDVLPFFKQSETFHPDPDQLPFDPAVHGDSGSLHTSFHPLAPISQRIVDSFLETGLEWKPNMFYTGDNQGVGHVPAPSTTAPAPAAPISFRAPTSPPTSRSAATYRPRASSSPTASTVPRSLLGSRLAMTRRVRRCSSTPTPRSLCRAAPTTRRSCSCSAASVPSTSSTASTSPSSTTRPPSAKTCRTTSSRSTFSTCRSPSSRTTTSYLTTVRWLLPWAAT